MKISLKAYRANANLSAREVAEIIGVTEKTIYTWESSEDSFMKANLENVIKLAKVYGVSIDDLTG